MKPIKVDSVIKTYMELRFKKEEIERKAKEEVAEIKSSMEKIEGYLLARMDEEGVSSYKTAHGTAFSTETDFATVADWQSVIDFVKTNDAFHMLEKRVNKSSVRSWMEEGNPVPPGVNYGVKRDISVRRPTPSKD